MRIKPLVLLQDRDTRYTKASIIMVVVFMCCHVPRFVANTMELLFFADATELPLVRTTLILDVMCMYCQRPTRFLPSGISGRKEGSCCTGRPPAYEQLSWARAVGVHSIASNYLQHFHSFQPTKLLLAA